MNEAGGEAQGVHGEVHWVMLLALSPIGQATGEIAAGKWASLAIGGPYLRTNTMPNTVSPFPDELAGAT